MLHAEREWPMFSPLSTRPGQSEIVDRFVDIIAKDIIKDDINFMEEEK